jgi:glucose/arabinose dehydrogenase
VLVGNPSAPNGSYHGYPYCFTVYNSADIVDKSMQPGDWFAQDTSSQYNDAWCNANAIKPLAILPPHTAPLDLKFGVRQSDTNLYVPLHGSWNRSPPQVSIVAVESLKR